MILQSKDASSESLAVSIRAIYQSTKLLSMATVTAAGQPWINQAYFSFDSDLVLYVITQPDSEHTINLAATGGFVAVAVSDSQQTGEGGKRGLQAFGRWREATEGVLLAEGFKSYASRYPELRAVLQNEHSLVDAGWRAKMYAIEPQRFKIFDEVTFGMDTWVDAQVSD